MPAPNYHRNNRAGYKNNNYNNSQSSSKFGQQQQFGNSINFGGNMKNQRNDGNYNRKYNHWNRGRNNNNHYDRRDNQTNYDSNSYCSQTPYNSYNNRKDNHNYNRSDDCERRSYEDRHNRRLGKGQKRKFHEDEDQGPNVSSPKNDIRIHANLTEKSGKASRKCEGFSYSEDEIKRVIKKNNVKPTEQESTSTNGTKGDNLDENVRDSFDSTEEYPSWVRDELENPDNKGISKGQIVARHIISKDLDVNIEALITESGQGKELAHDFATEFQKRVHLNKNAFSVIQTMKKELKLSKARTMHAIEQENAAIEKQKQAETREQVFKEEAEKLRKKVFEAEAKTDLFKKQLNKKDKWRKLALSAVGNIRALGIITEEIVSEETKLAQAPEYFMDEIRQFNKSLYLVDDKRIPIKNLTDLASTSNTKISIKSHDRNFTYKVAKSEDGKYVWAKQKCEAGEGNKKDGLLDEIDFDN